MFARLTTLLAAALIAGCGEATTQRVEQPNISPNILLVVVDDVGYTDLGAYGSEIRTPNIDSLAAQGTMFASFYAAPTCSPTRSMLMSGTDNHIAGVGNMVEAMAPNQQGQPGYEGHLLDDIVPLPQLLSDAGYRSFMVGKWHLGEGPGQSPNDKGFQRSFALLYGGASHLTMRGPESERPVARYIDDYEPVTSLPENFFSSDFYTDKIIEFIDSEGDTDEPFFGYLAYTAPHWPLQATDEFIDRYRGRYDEGWDVLRRERFEQAQRLGLIAADARFPERHPNVPAWETLSAQERRVEARKMEIFAAMVENLDYNMGRLMDYLSETDQLENTFIFFMSDNGPEGVNLGGPVFDPWKEASDNSYENMGRENSFVYYGPQWAQSGAAPFDLFKSFPSEGGIRVPAFAHYPGLATNGATHTEFVTVLDLMPTFLQLANSEHPAPEYEGRTVEAMRGESMLPMFNGERNAVHDDDYVMGWELFGRRAIRYGGWKLRWIESPNGSGEWELFNLADDPTEQRNITAEEPAQLAELISHWETYQQETGLILPEGRIGY